MQGEHGSGWQVTAAGVIIRAVVTALIETKLQPPRPRPTTIDRVRLLDRLGRAGVPRLVLVSAPPGFGKSTLVAQWIAGLRGTASVAWVSLDAADADPGRFWTYVAAAVERAIPGAGAAALGHLETEGRTDLAVTSLVNGLAAGDGDTFLVLDDLHVVDSRDVADSLTTLLEHLPAQAHLVLVTRSDPVLPIARFRARGELLEIRAADLRFTPDEAAAYLNERMGLTLADGDVGRLEARTEGWIAALQLAAISLRGRADPGTFVAAFAGDDRHIVDYLADEVLDRQPPAVRAFLLATSILDRITGPLADAVTGTDGGAATLEALDRANLFLIPLDDRRQWYRYHHLFADLLRVRLREQRPDDPARLHARASAWWAANGDSAAAIDHALAAGDAGHAADLIELAAHDLRRTRQEATLRRWLDALPDDTFANRPVLAIAHAGALLATGELRGVQARLEAVDRWIPAAASAKARATAEADGMLVRHPTALAHLPGAAALYRAASARLQGDLDATIRYAQVAHDVALDDQPLERGGAAGILALALWSRGDLEAAHETWEGALTDLARAGHEADMLGGLLAMADIRIAQGRLAEARGTLERGLAIGMAASPPLRGSADMLVGLAALDLEQGDLRAAAERLEASTALGDAAGLPQHTHRSLACRAGLRAAAGDHAAAIRLLDEAEHAYNADFFPEVRPIASVRARLRTNLGLHADTLAWASARGRTMNEPVAYVHEHEHVTLAHARVAHASKTGLAGGLEETTAFIERLLDEAHAGGRMRTVVELTGLQAMARAAAGDRTGAASSMDRAIVLAEPEGLVRAIVDLGPNAALLARDAARRAPNADYARRVAAAFDPSPTPSRAHAGLVEPLSDREHEVLRLLATDLPGPEIASQLFVSLNTLRTHTKNIFAKLGVNSRRAAVTRAEELGLLGPR